ncbi:MAG TPA: hypothetical protein VJ731_14205 [Terriglobales bacterium]|nr:hypothetical protein [Terriglobales bacterium]
MPNRTHENCEAVSAHEATKHPLVVRVTDNDFQCEVLEKLARLEAKMEMLAGGAQPGRISLIENRLAVLERNDVRRGVYDRLVNAALTTAISVLIALHDRWWK